MLNGRFRESKSLVQRYCHHIKVHVPENSFQQRAIYVPWYCLFTCLHWHPWRLRGGHKRPQVHNFVNKQKRQDSREGLDCAVLCACLRLSTSPGLHCRASLGPSILCELYLLHRLACHHGWPWKDLRTPMLKHFCSSPAPSQACKRMKAPTVVTTKCRDRIRG